MADKKVGAKTGKSTQAGRDVYTTEDGENVSEKSTTFKYKGQWINVPSIHKGYQYDDDTLRMMLDAEVIEPTSAHKSETDAVKAAVERSKNLKFNEGGTPMQRQMELFKDGGLKDEGGMVDEVSGNEVPIGGTKEGVRDDIPANVSEGEFIMPADVVRYHGLDKMMQIRQEAKMGLKQMEAMGQMGNSDEATMDDDMPFGMADLIVVGESDEPMEFADGGFVPVRDYAVGGLTTGTTGSGRVNQPVATTPTAPVTPVDGPATRRLTPELTTAPRISIDFKKLMGEASIEYKQYVNSAGESTMIPFIGGVPQFPIPAGYSLYTGDNFVGSGTAGTAADTIVYATNTATAEYGGSSDNDTISGMPTPEPINWSELSTEDLIKKSNSRTGVGGFIAKAAMGFMGPFGAIGYALMRNEDKKIAQIIADRIASGGLTASQLATLKETQGKLTPKGFTIIGKLMDTVGSALGLGKDEIEASKQTTSTIDKQVATQALDVKNIEDVSYNPTLLDAQLDEMDFQQTLNTFVSAYKDGLRRSLPQEQLDKLADNAAKGTNGYRAIGEDAVREALSNIRPDYKSPFASVANDALFSVDKPYSDMSPDERARFESLKLSEIGSGMTTEEQIAERKRLASAYQQPQVSADPRFPTTPELTDDDMGLPIGPVPAPTVPSGRLDTKGGTPDMSTDLSSRIAAANEKTAKLLKSTSYQPTTMGATELNLPAVRSGVANAKPIVDASSNVSDPTASTTPTGPFLNVPRNLGRSSTLEEAQSAAIEKGYVPPPVATPPVATPPVATPPVAEQTQQAFAPYDAERMLKINEIPTAPKAAAPYDAERMLKINEIPTANPDLFDPRNLGGAEGYGITGKLPDAPTAQTFKQAFAANRLAGNETFMHKGKSYTTQTAEEAAPKGTNSLYQQTANLFTPNDDKEYVGGVLQDRAGKTTNTLYQRVANALTPDDGKEYVGGSIKETKAPSAKSKAPKVSSGRTTAQIQADINKEVANGWTSRANALVKEREASKSAPAPSRSPTPAPVAKPYSAAANTAAVAANKASNNDNDSGGNNDKIVCTEMYRQTQLADWQQTIKIWDVYQKRHLTPLHQVGYHWLFKPYVRGMKNSSILTKLGAALAKHRTQHLRHVLTKGKAKDDILGNIWCKIIHPLVYVAGVIKQKIGK